MRPLQYVFLLLIVLNLAQLALNYHLLDNLTSKQRVVLELTERLQDTSGSYSLLLEEVKKKDEVIEEQRRKLREAERKIVSVGGVQKEIYVLGVTGGRGIALKLLVEKRPGDGRILVDIKDTFLEMNLQEAALNSLAAAEKYTGQKVKDDVVFTLLNPLKESIVLTGESAGAAIAIAIVSLIEGRDIRRDVVITGAVTPAGKILRVSQIDLKAQAAHEAGAKLLLVPKGQSKEVKVQGLKVVEVETLQDALSYALY